VNYWEIVAGNLSKAGCTCGLCLSRGFQQANDLDCRRASRATESVWFVVRADEELTAFWELEAAIRESGLRNESEKPVGLRFGGCKWQTIPPSL